MVARRELTVCFFFLHVPECSGTFHVTGFIDGPGSSLKKSCVTARIRTALEAVTDIAAGFLIITKEFALFEWHQQPDNL